MKTTLHRITAIALLLCLSAGVQSYFCFNIGQLLCKINAHNNKTQSANLDVIKIPVKKLAAESDASEMWVSGRLYDVRGYVIVNDTALVSVYRDINEECLVNAIATLFESGDQYRTNPASSHFVKYKTSIPDGKILNTPYKLSFTACTAVSSNYPEHLKYTLADLANPGVVKPPPPEYCLVISFKPFY